MATRKSGISGMEYWPGYEICEVEGLGVVSTNDRDWQMVVNRRIEILPRHRRALLSTTI